MTDIATERRFGSTIQCECGRVHTLPPKEVVYGDDAFERLPEVCRRATKGRGATVVMDCRTRDAAGARAVEALRGGGWDVGELLIADPPDGGWPVCDETTKDELAGRLEEVDLIVPVGSGVISDLGKWLAFESDVPFVTFATAASMNGYSSSNIAMTIGGLKTLLEARPPEAVLASPSVLAGAPREMTAAGLGDVLAKSVSSADWRLNNLLFGDYYCRRSVELIADIEPLYMTRGQAILEGEADALEAVFHALLLTGAAMTMAGTSAPASGGEHLISHTLDMMSSLDGAGHDLHGRQVGVATVLCSELYRRVLEVESPVLVEPSDDIAAEFWGPLTGPIANEFRRKLPRMRAAAEKLSAGSTWDKLREGLSPMLCRPQELADCLAGAGAACRAEDIRCRPERLVSAFVNAHQIRERFTILDLARLVGVLPGAAQEIVEKWA